MSQKDAGTINEELLVFQKKWFDEIVKEWIVKSRTNGKKKRYFLMHNDTEEFGFAEPFFTSLYEADDCLPIVMFVGQETNGWGDYINFEKQINEEGINAAIKDSQDFVSIFTENNVVNRNKELRIQENKAYDSHAFWNFIRAFYEGTNNNIRVVWTELDKIHYSCPGHNCIKLWKKDERELNAAVMDGESILVSEIKTIRPDLVVFLTGNSYVHSMETAICGFDINGNKLTAANPIYEFSVFGIPCVWTYHPRYLRQKGKETLVIEMLSNHIQQAK